MELYTQLFSSKQFANYAKNNEGLRNCFNTYHLRKNKWHLGNTIYDN